MSVSILVVDDEPDIMDLFHQQFRRELRNGAYVLYFALSGREALNQLVVGFEPELLVILSDINMPEMDGIELLREVRGRWPKLPVLMITAYADATWRGKASDSGASDFLSKPIDFDHLKKRILALLPGSGSK